MDLPQASPAAIDARSRVAVALLRQGNDFLMQLRDDDPNIFFPGHWGFFGGHIEPGEQEDTAIRRELQEEIGYCPAAITFWQRNEAPNVIRFVYYAELDVALETLVLGEGVDMALLTPEAIAQGECYSHRVQAVRPIGKPHQQLLLQFMEQSKIH